MPEEGVVPGIKFDGEKPDWSLLDLRVMEDTVRVLTYGARKYTTPQADGANNWKKVPKARKRYFAALLRHIAAYQADEVNDPESGLDHLSHAMCCLIFLRSFQKNGGGE